MIERVFGHTITNSAGKEVPTRIIAEQHIIDDLGFIPTVEQWLVDLPIQLWMSGSRKKEQDNQTVAAYRNSLKVSKETI